jgi:hypothetical protein
MGLHHGGQEPALHRRHGGEEHADRRDQPGREQEALAGAPQVGLELGGLEAVEGVLDDDGLPGLLVREGRRRDPRRPPDAGDAPAEPVRRHPIGRVRPERRPEVDDLDAFGAAEGEQAPDGGRKGREPGDHRVGPEVALGVDQQEDEGPPVARGPRVGRCGVHGAYLRVGVRVAGAAPGRRSAAGAVRRQAAVRRRTPASSVGRR